MHSQRHLSLRGKAVVANAMATSKLWYTGRVLDMPRYHIIELKRSIFHFVYGITQQKQKPEFLRRETLFLEWGNGGIGLVDISLKFKAFRILDMAKIVLEAVSDNELTKSARLGLYWCGGALNILVKLNTKHKVGYDINDEKPHYYKNSLALFKDFMERHCDESTDQEKIEKLKKLDAKTLYSIMNRERDRPKVERDFPQANWTQQWKDSACKHVDSDVKNTIFKLSHEVLPTKYRIYCQNNRKMSIRRYEIDKKKTLDSKRDMNQMGCPLCKDSEESQIHLMIECAYAKKAWLFVEEILRGLCNHRLKITYDMLARGKIPNVQQRDSVLIIIYTAAHSIWTIRNLVFKEGDSYDDQSILRLLKKKLSLRIRADHARKDFEAFLKMWGFETIIDKNHTNETEIALRF